MSDDVAPYGELAARMRPALLRLNRRIRLEHNVQPYTLTQLSALTTIDVRGPLSAGELAAFERVQPPSLTKVIALLEDAGLVSRDAHPSDKRQAIIAITPAGAALLASSRRTGDAWLSGRLARLTDAEREQLQQLAPILDKLVEDPPSE